MRDWSLDVARARDLDLLAEPERSAGMIPFG